MNYDASFWVAVAFVLFVGVLLKLKVPSMIVRGLDGHADKVKKELELAATMRKEAEALAAQYAHKLVEAESEAAALRERTEREISAMKTEAETAVSDYIARRTKAAEVRIAQAEQAILDDLKAQAADLAIGATAHLVKAQVAAGKGADIMTGSLKALKGRLN